MKEASDVTDEIARLLAEEGEHAETHDLPEGATPNRIGNTRSTVYSVRLNEDEVEALQRMAAARGLPASTLARLCIVERINANDGTDLRSIVRDEVRSAVRDALAG